MDAIKFYKDVDDNVDIPVDYSDDSDGDDSRISAAEYGIKESPCKLRPDTWAPCELLKKSKNNEVCFSCGLRRGLRANDTKEARIRMAAILDMEPETLADELGPGRSLYPRKKPKWELDFLSITNPCKFEGCPHAARFRNNTLCAQHDMLVRTRESKGESGECLYRPARPRRRIV